MYSGLNQWDFLPPMDVYETRDSIVIELELPEVDRESVKITCEGESVIIEGVKSYKLGLERVKFLRLERSTGPFKRVVKLPFAPNSSRIKATLKKGVLKVEIFKNVQTIEVEAEDE